MVNSKNAFWQALIITVFVFIAGLVLGFYVELSNVSKSDLMIRSAEIDLMDQQIKISGLNNNFNFNCDIAKKNLFNFADEIYLDIAEFEEEDGQSKFTVNQRTVLHKRYDLLRVNLWMEALEIKERCDENFHTVIYLFDYGSKDVDIKSQQRVLSLVLMDLKYAYPEEVLLIPIASNLDLGSVEVIKHNYNISQAPVIIIDESSVITSLVSLEELEKSVFDSKKKSNTQKVIVLNS